MIRDNYLDITKIVKDKEIFKLFRAVEASGGVLRFVGGCVRDAIAGIKGFDLDLATDLSPDELVEACQDYDIKTVPIGIKYGTVGVVFGKNVLEVTSLRKDVKTDGRHAIVEFTTDWSVDASRRDLTINAVYADEKGNVFDYYDGIDDLEKGIVKFIGNPDSRIKEDYLRILRFFRFYSIFGKTDIDKKALKACVDNKKGLKKISAERIRDELLKILVSPNVVKTLKIMADNEILSDFILFKGDFESLEFILNMYDDSHTPDAALRRLFILTNPNKKLAEKITSSLKLSKKNKDFLVNLANTDLDIKGLLTEKNIDKFVYIYGKDFYISKILTSVAINKYETESLAYFIEMVRDRVVPIFPIRGKDIINLGIKDQKIGKVLNLLEESWISSGFMLNRDELLVKAELVALSVE